MLSRLNFDRCWLYGGICALYLICPYHLLNGYMGPLFDRRAIFAVLGLLAGCALHRVWLNRMDARSFSAPCDSRLFKGALFVLTVCTVGIELLDYPMYLSGDVESQTLVFLVPSVVAYVTWHVLNAEPYVILAGAALAAFGFLCSHDSIDDSSCNSFAVSPQAVFDTLEWIPAISIVSGIAMRLAWTVFQVPVLGAATSLTVVLTGCVAPLLSAVVFLTYLALDRVSFVSLREVVGVKYYARISYVQMLVGFVCSGQLIAIVVMRYAYNHIACVITLLILLALLFVTFLRIRARVSLEDQDEITVVEQIKDLLEHRYGFSPREALFASEVLLGKTGKEIAFEHDVKPGTVRSTLYRAYQKLGVHGERELGERLSGDSELAALLNRVSQPSFAHDGENMLSLESGQACGRIAGLIESAGTVLLLCALLCVLLPAGTMRGPWGFGQLPVVGISLGLIGTGLLGAAFEYTRGLRSRLDSINPTSEVEKNGLFVTVLFGVICLAATAFCLSHIENGELFLALGSYSDAIALVSYGVVASMTLRLVDGIFSTWNRISVIQLAASLVLWAISVRFEAGALVFIEAALGFLMLLPIHTYGARAHCEIVASGEIGEGGDTVCEAALFSLVALCFEEWWRSLGQSSFLLISIPFFVSISVCLLLSRRRWFSVSSTALMIALVCPLVVAGYVVFDGSLFSSLPCSLLLLCVFFGGLGLRRVSYTSRLCAGCAMAGSLIAINKVQDYMSNPSPLIRAMFISGDNFGIVVGTVLSITCLLAGALLWRYAKGAWEAHAAQTLGNANSSDEGDVFRRQRALLVSRGLSDVQAEIMLLTARGKTARDISDVVCYSPATVKALRTASYRQLQVGDRARLIKLLSQVNDV